MHAPQEIAANYRSIGKKKCEMTAARQLLLGFMAGMFIALAAVGANTASSTVSVPSMGKLVAGCVFPVGLAMVLIAGSELFTGNTLLFIPLFCGDIKLRQLLRNWLFVYLGNFIGALFVAVLCKLSGQWGLFGGQLAVTTVKAAVSKCSLSFGSAVALGVGCNILVCIAVWMSFSSTSAAGKIAALYLPIMLFVLSGFEHSIANMYYVPAGIMAAADPVFAELAVGAGVNLSCLSWGSFFAHNLLPVTLGNIIAGALISTVYWFVYLKKDNR